MSGLVRFSGLRRTAAAALVGVVVVSGVVASAGAASADTTIIVKYPVKGSTFIKAPNFTLGLGPG